MRYAGMGWPNTEWVTNLEALIDLPGTFYVMLDADAVKHYDNLKARKPHAEILVRAFIRDLWRTPEGLADAVFERIPRDWLEDPEFRLVIWNEANLNYERGWGTEADDTNEEISRATMETMAHRWVDTVKVLRDRGVRCKQHFPAWSQGHWDDENADAWIWALEHADACDVHAYGDPPYIHQRVGWYVRNSPRPVYVTETAYDRLPYNQGLERHNLRVLAGLKVPAAHFIWEWASASPENAAKFNVIGNPERLALYQNPPAADGGAPVPEPTSHTHDVGPGLLQKITASGAQPVACSSFLPLGRSPAEIECAYASDGSEWRWELATGRCWRIRGEKA